MANNITIAFCIAVLLFILILMFGAQFFFWLSRVTKKWQDKLEKKADELERRRIEKADKEDTDGT